MTSTLPIRIPYEADAAAGAPSKSSASQTDRAHGEGIAHAKAILFGEHAVVYGAPAIALPIHELEAHARVESAPSGIRIESELYSGDASAAPAQLLPVVTAIHAALSHIGRSNSGLKVRILSAIPHSRGLGSSAAVAAAIARSIANWAGVELSIAELFEIVQQAERVAHGKPSGLDARAVTAESTIRFDFGVISSVPAASTFHFVLADSGIAGSTANAVAAVRELRRTDQANTAALLSRLAEIAEGASALLAAGDHAAIGEGMYEAHTLLQRLGVSSPELDSLVAASLASGALGAKLTGGGIGGCIIVLARSSAHAEELGSALRSAGAPRTWTAMVPAS